MNLKNQEKNKYQPRNLNKYCQTNLKDKTVKSGEGDKLCENQIMMIIRDKHETRKERVRNNSTKNYIFPIIQNLMGYSKTHT